MKNNIKDCIKVADSTYENLIRNSRRPQNSTWSAAQLKYFQDEFAKCQEEDFLNMDKGKVKIILFKGRGLFSKLIQWKTNSQYSHAAILLPDGETIIESWQGAGVRKKKMTDWEDTETFNVDYDPFYTQMIINFLETQKGKDYDYLGALGIALNKNIHNKNKFFCFKLVFAAFQYIGVNLLERTEPHECTGNLLYRSSKIYY
jgi:uncharacterized protein YycO